MASTLLARVHNPGDGPRPEPAPMAATRLARDTPRTTPASQPKCARPDMKPVPARAWLRHPSHRMCNVGSNTNDSTARTYPASRLVGVSCASTTMAFVASRMPGMTVLPPR